MHSYSRLEHADMKRFRAPREPSTALVVAAVLAFATVFQTFEWWFTN